MKWLKIKTLEAGYSDPREVVLHASFQALVNFVNERMFKMIDWQWNEYNQNIHNETMELYEWWTKVRPNRKDPLFAEGVKSPDIYFTPANENGFYNMNQWWSSPEAQQRWDEACKASRQFEEDCEAEDQAMLKRLVEIRMGMWT